MSNIDDRGTQTSALPAVAGVLMIVDAGFKFLGLLAFLAAGIFAVAPPAGFAETLAVFIFLAILLAVIGVLLIIGGISALQRRRWGIALAGSIASVVTFSLLGIAALILLVISRQDFKS